MITIFYSALDFVGGIFLVFLCLLGALVVIAACIPTTYKKATSYPERGGYTIVVTGFKRLGPLNLYPTHRINTAGVREYAESIVNEANSIITDTQGKTYK